MITRVNAGEDAKLAGRSFRSIAISRNLATVVTCRRARLMGGNIHSMKLGQSHREQHRFLLDDVATEDRNSGTKPVSLFVNAHSHFA